MFFFYLLFAKFVQKSCKRNFYKKKKCYQIVKNKQFLKNFQTISQRLLQRNCRRNFCGNYKKKRNCQKKIKKWVCEEIHKKMYKPKKFSMELRKNFLREFLSMHPSEKSRKNMWGDSRRNLRLYWAQNRISSEKFGNWKKYYETLSFWKYYKKLATFS